MRHGPVLRTALLAALALAGAAPTPSVFAQVPAAEHWQTIESTHFRVTFTPGLEQLAAHAAAAAERGRAALTAYLANPPAGRVDIILSDNADYSNGSTTPFPSNRIYLFAKPPVDSPELSYLPDWLELVIVHELTHAFHLDATSRFGEAVRSVFGRVPLLWPVFPAVGSPGWSIEGLAVAAESGTTSMGRLNGTYHDMVARTAALEDVIDDIDRLSATTPVWPGYQRAYVYGSLFIHQLQQQHGAEAARRIVSATASAVVPPFLWYDRVGERAVGAAFRTAYNAWRDTAAARYLALADTIRGRGETKTRTLAAGGGVASYPRWSRDGRWIAYARLDRRSTPELTVIDAQSGAEFWSRRRHSAASAAFMPDGSLLTSDLEYRDRDHVYFGVRRYARSGVQRAGGAATQRARLQDVDVTADGTRAVAVENLGGSNRLVTFDPEGGELTPLTEFRPNVHWAEPRWSPAGDAIAVARWSAGGRYDVIIVDAAGGVREEITHGIGVNSSPAWSPDGRFVVFASDRTGISNLYAYDRSSGRLRQLTSVLTGAFQPDVSPDGSTVVFSAYHHDGYHLELLRFDTAAFREPETPRLPQLPAAPLLGSPAADTAASVPAPYRAAASVAPHWWAPLLLDQESGTFLGAGSAGEDLVGRHVWSAWAAAVPRNGRTQGALAYEYRGLPPIAGTGLQPSLQLSASREWDRLLSPEKAGDPILDEREDMLGARTALLYRKYRYVVSTSLGGELVHRRQSLTNGGGRRLLDPEDDLLGVRATALFSNTRRYPFSISAEDGIHVQVGARQRWDRSRGSGVNSQGDTVALDAGERELSMWSAGYLAIGRVAFANAVLAGRGSAVLRDGAGASAAGVGGTSGGEQTIGGLLDLGGGRFLPVRGFPAGTRRGTSAWSVSAELRVPLALLAFKPRPLPLYLDRLSAAAFIDAGDASCASGEGCSPERLGPTLVGTGAEIWLHTSALGAGFLLRAGGAVPLHGTGAHAPRWYLQAGVPF